MTMYIYNIHPTYKRIDKIDQTGHNIDKHKWIVRRMCSFDLKIKIKRFTHLFTLYQIKIMKDIYDDCLEIGFSRLQLCLYEASGKLYYLHTYGALNYFIIYVMTALCKSLITWRLLKSSFEFLRVSSSCDLFCNDRYLYNPDESVKKALYCLYFNLSLSK